MADSEGKNYYWESLDQNTTGENVGVVLDSLCDIVAENEVEEDQNVVKWIPGEEGQKGHFELGEGGGQVPPINAGHSQLLIGTGDVEPTKWAKGNECNLYGMPFWKDNNITPVTGGVTPSPTYFGIGMIEGPPFETAFGTVKPASTQSVLNYPITYLKNGFTSADTAIAKIFGDSKIEIGTKAITYTGVKWWSGEDFEETLTSPTIKIKGTAKIEMLGGADPRSTPAISMRGNCLIDMYANPGPNYWLGQAHPDREDIRKYINPFSGRDNDNSPILQIHDGATVSICERATLQMRNNATAILFGNADIHIAGGQYSTGYHNSDSGIHLQEGYRTQVYLHPGSMVRMKGTEEFPASVSVDEGQMIFGSGAIVNGKDHDGWDGSPGFFFNGDFVDYSTRATCIHDSQIGTFDYKHPHCSIDTKFDDLHIMKQKIGYPLVGYEGSVSMHICSSDSGRLGMQLATTDSSTIGIVASCGGSSTTQIKYGIGGNSKLIGDIVPDDGSSTYFRFGPDNFAETSIFFEPSGITSIKFNPLYAFGLTVEPNHSEIICQWNRFKGIFEGNDSFVQVDGNTHLESWSGTVILRNSEINPVAEKISRTNYMHYPKLYEATKEISVQGEIIIDTDLSNMSISDIETQFASELKNATSLPKDDPHNNDYTWNRFTGTSKTKLPIKYTETLKIYNIKIINWNRNISFNSNTYYTRSTLVESEEFKNWIRDTFKYEGDFTLTLKADAELRRYSGSSTTYTYYLGSYYLDINNITITKTHSVADRKDYIYEYIGSFDMSRNTQAGIKKGIREIVNSDTPYSDYQTVLKNAYTSWSEVSEQEYIESLEIKNVKDLVYSEYIISIKSYISTNINTFFDNSEVQAYFRKAFKCDRTVAGTNCSVTYYRYRNGYYYYKVKNSIAEYDSYLVKNAVNNTANYKLNYPDTSYADLPQDVKTFLNQTSSKPYPVGAYDFSNAETGTYHAIEHPRYRIKTTSVYRGAAQHLGKEWYRPIQTADRVGAETWDQSPIIQAYGPVNCVLREGWSQDAYTHVRYTFTPTETYDLTDKYEFIKQFESGADYAGFETFLRGQIVDQYESVILNSDDSITVACRYYSDTNAHLNSYANNPIVEITDDSEFRLYNGIRIKAETVSGESGITLSNPNTNEEISFSFKQLEALKNLIVNPPTPPLAPAENQSF